ncbi:type II restriction endonuclease [Slackia piriformis]|nr:type II restriction endonuclease [Slackia piriformis]
MPDKDFDKWLSHFRDSICDYGYYVNFAKVYENVDEIKVELNIMNSLVGSQDIEQDFEMLVSRYPEVLRCIPTLLAVRDREIYAMDEDGAFVYDFTHYENDVEQYKNFMRKTGLFDLIANHVVGNLVDYATGVEVGLDSNGRKNRGGHLMEDLVEGFIRQTGVEYYKEMYLSDIERLWGIDLSSLSNQGSTRKRFDFVVKTPSTVYAIETNFYKGPKGGGSKLNETARSYKMLAQESEEVDGFEFVWITDGTAWRSARGNLQETFEAARYVYSLFQLEAGKLKDLFEG